MSFAKGSGERKESWEKYLLTLVATFGAFFIGMVIAVKLRNSFSLRITDVRSSINFAIQLVPYLFGSAALLACMRYLHQRPVLSFFTSRSKFDWQRFFFAFGLWFLFQCVFMLMAKASGAPIVFDLNPSKLIPLVLVSLTILPIQTAFEDVLYRGYLFQGLSRATGKAALSALALSILFGLMHSGNPSVKIFGSVIILYYIISGLFLALLAHFDDGLELGMGYHFANNFFGAVVLTNTWQVFQTNALFTDFAEPQMGWEIWIPLFTIQPAMLYAFYRIYRWKNPLKRISE